MSKLDVYLKAREVTARARAALDETPEAKALMRATRMEEIARLAVIPTCPHPTEFRTHGQWHHGYGKMLPFDYCTLCKKYNAWPSSSCWSLEYPRISDDD